MKRIDHWYREGRPLSRAVRVFAGMEPPSPTREERAERRAIEAEAKAEARAEREAIQAVERQALEERLAREAALLAEWRLDAGAPRKPQNPTGFYTVENLDGAFFAVGSGPWPDFRYPGLAWERTWKQPKPDDVPWRDELPPPRVWAADPQPIREAVGGSTQGMLF